MRHRVIGIDDLDAVAQAWDRAADSTEGADEFCSSTLWSFSAARSFSFADEPAVVTDGESFCGMRRVMTDRSGVVLVGLDPVWGFATPFVGLPGRCVELTSERMAMDRWDLAILSGQARGLPVTEALIDGLGPRYRLGVGPVETRLQANLTCGFDQWWGRRSGRFRQRARQIERRARGVVIDDVSDHPVDEIFTSILAIEGQSWKADDRTGLNDPDMEAFYRRIATSMSGGGDLRCLVARLDGCEVGYILGGIRGGTYRGLQLSYSQMARELSVGHLLQLEQIRRVAPSVEVYDLGMDMEYKRRYADRADETFAIIVGHR